MLFSIRRAIVRHLLLRAGQFLLEPGFQRTQLALFDDEGVVIEVFDYVGVVAAGVDF